MVLKTLFMGLLGFDFVLNQASAQFNNHHQQYFVDPTDLYTEKVFDTKALTPVQIGKKGVLDWAFASTIDEQDGDLRALLVKLGPNFPGGTPFQIEWAFQYLAGFGVSLEVEDVYYEDNVKDEGYVLCGKYTQEGESSGFVLRVDPQGTPITAKVYNEISVFTSIVPWQNNKGYVAVGQFKEGEDNVKDAAFVSIKKKNLKVGCAIDMKGFFPRKALGFVEGQLNKVIQYRGNSFAAVGDTTWQLGVAGQDNSKCARNSDVLVAVVNKKCKVDFVNQYGDSTGGNGGETNERGLSIAQYSKKGGLVITGNTNQLAFDDFSCEKKNFDDTLAFRISSDGDTVEWMGQYLVSDANLPDFGTAIQMSTSKKTPVLVAGEATTAYFGTNGLKKVTKDAFLLELNKKNGNVNFIDFFGLADGVDNGALIPGNLDLHLAQDGSAVIMGNARIIENQEVSNPYLIERYQTVKENCVDVRVKIEKRVYKFPMTNETTVKNRKVKNKNLGVKELEFTLEQQIVCEKAE